MFLYFNKMLVDPLLLSYFELITYRNATNELSELVTGYWSTSGFLRHPWPSWDPTQTPILNRFY